jgi:hypothetical protein
LNNVGSSAYGGMPPRLGSPSFEPIMFYSGGKLGPRAKDILRGIKIDDSDDYVFKEHGLKATNIAIQVRIIFIEPHIGL